MACGAPEAIHCTGSMVRGGSLMELAIRGTGATLAGNFLQNAFVKESDDPRQRLYDERHRRSRGSVRPRRHGHRARRLRGERRHAVVDPGAASGLHSQAAVHDQAHRDPGQRVYTAGHRRHRLQSDGQPHADPPRRPSVRIAHRGWWSATPSSPFRDGRRVRCQAGSGRERRLSAANAPVSWTRSGKSHERQTGA